MSSLKIGLVTSQGEESDLLASLLRSKNTQLTCSITPEEISAEHINNSDLSVWLLNINDNAWHDSVDELLDESDVPVYFNEPGALANQAHPEYWCNNLIDRLYEISGLEKLDEPEDVDVESPVDNDDSIESVTETVEEDTVEQGSIENIVQEDSAEEEIEVTLDTTNDFDSEMPLSSSLNELEMSADSLNSEIATELVSELESIPDVLKEANNSFDDDVLLSLNDEDELDTEEILVQELIEDDIPTQLELDEPQVIDEELTSELEISDVEIPDVEVPEIEMPEVEGSQIEIDAIEIDKGEIEEVEEVELDWNSDDELSLEPINNEGSSQEKITGKANFLDDSFEQEIDSGELNLDENQSDGTLDEMSEELESDSLSLEPMSDDDRSNFSDTAQEEQLSIEIDEPGETNLQESLSDSGLELEEIVEQSDIELESSEELELTSESELDNEAELASEIELENEAESASEVELDNEAELASEIKLDNSDSQTIENIIVPPKVDDREPEEFEIPMLDEEAPGVEFEEVVEAVASNETDLTPCWVIGASLGGPAAVKRFIQCIPQDIKASFIIAQHIDENFLKTLSEILTTNSQFEVSIATGSNEMMQGTVLIAPLKGKTTFLKDGSMLVDRSQKWTEPYSPCIDDVIDSVSKAYGKNSGAIIFSGMGEDGSLGAKKMRERGGVVWAQSVDTCANSSMPEAIINNDLADYVGTPEQLAETLVERLNG